MARFVYYCYKLYEKGMGKFVFRVMKMHIQSIISLSRVGFDIIDTNLIFDLSAQCNTG